MKTPNRKTNRRLWKKAISRRIWLRKYFSVTFTHTEVYTPQFMNAMCHWVGYMNEGVPFKTPEGKESVYLMLADDYISDSIREKVFASFAEKGLSPDEVIIWPKSVGELPTRLTKKNNDDGTVTTTIEFNYDIVKREPILPEVKFLHGAPPVSEMIHPINGMDVIVGVAVYDIDRNIVYVDWKPKRHHHIVHHLAVTLDEHIRHDAFVQGFYTLTGKFLDRVDAYKLAKQNGQFNRMPNGTQLEQLFSEDLW